MVKSLVALSILLCLCHGGHSFFRSKGAVWNGVGDPGKPLFLTPLIEKGDYATAKQLSAVDLSPFKQSIKSYSGYLTVDKTYNSNLFFWFFQADDALNKPVILWLQGGPGASSLFGLFVENGPFYVDEDSNLVDRDYAWTDSFNMLYIDQPVGTGFSFTDDDRGYLINEDQVGAALLNALTQFFTLFSEFQQLPFYITGESYGGKYVPAAAYAIMKAGSSVINLRGIAIGNGAISPLKISDGMGELLFQYGLVNELEKAVFDSNATEIAQLVKNGQLSQATLVFDALMFGSLSGAPSYFQNVTGCTSHYNFVHCNDPGDNYTTLLTTDAFRRAIHVGATPFSDGSQVSRYLTTDFMNSTAPQLVALLNSERYSVLIYNGNLDIICALPFTEHTLSSDLNDWKYAQEYANAPKRRWFVETVDWSILGGYVRSVRNYFYQATVRGAGHMVPTDQPASARTLIANFVGGVL